MVRTNLLLIACLALGIGLGRAVEPTPPPSPKASPASAGSALPTPARSRPTSSRGLQPSSGSASKALPRPPGASKHPAGVDLWNPAAVRPLVEELMLPPDRKPPNRKPAVERIFYSKGVALTDGFIPTGGLSLTRPQTESCYRFTYHDGLVVKCEFFRTLAEEEKGHAPVQVYVVRYDQRGAPRLSGEFGRQGQCEWYKYAAYDDAGRLQVIYHLTPGYRLQLYDEFTYRPDNTSDGATEIRQYAADGKLEMTTVYENGELLLDGRGIHSRVKKYPRQFFLRIPMQYGLKPPYPGLEEPAK
jgi:hypothetical protein